MLSSLATVAQYRDHKNADRAEAGMTGHCDGQGTRADVKTTRLSASSEQCI